LVLCGPGWLCRRTCGKFHILGEWVCDVLYLPEQVGEGHRRGYIWGAEEVLRKIWTTIGPGDGDGIGGGRRKRMWGSLNITLYHGFWAVETGGGPGRSWKSV